MSKIKHIHLYRNGKVLGNRDLAVDKLKGFLNDNQDSDLDGVAILARYNSTSGDTTIVKTIVGFVYEGSNGTPKSITIFDNEATEGEISNLKTEIENKMHEAQVNANDYTDTKIATLDADDSPVDNNFVTSVSESDGKITVQRAAVSSSTKTVLVAKAEGGGVNLDVNIDGATIVKNDTNGKISVASAALTQYIGKDAVKVSEVDASNNNKTVSLEINGNDKILSQDTNGLSTTLSLIYDHTNRKLKLIGKNSEEPISNIDATAFVKDGMLNDTAVFTASATTQSITFSRSSNAHEYSGLTEGNHYLAFEFKISSGESSSYNYEILDATSIIDVYKNGNGLELSGHTFSVKLAQGSENFLTVDKDGVKIIGVKAAIDAAAASAKTEVKKATDDQHIDVDSAATDGHVTYTISSKDIASASGLSKEITDRKAADGKIKENVGLNADGSHITTTGNYTSGATTVVEEIAALDTKVKENADNITALDTKVTTNTNNITALETKVSKLSGVTDAIAAAAASAKTEVKKATDDQHIDVTIGETAADGHVTYVISSVDTASASGLSKEITDRENADSTIKESVGLGADGSHTPTSGNYTSSATTVTGEIAALDTKVKENADNITALETKVSKLGAVNGSNAITVAEASNGSTIAVKLSGTDSGLVIKNDGLAINFSAIDLECGDY